MKHTIVVTDTEYEFLGYALEQMRRDAEQITAFNSPALYSTQEAIKDIAICDRLLPRLGRGRV